jgi:hypothetical protein
MPKDEIIKHMQDVLDEVIKQDEYNWGELLEDEDYEEIDLDKAWHRGYMSAITTVRNILDD